MISGTVSAWHSRAALELATPGHGRKFNAGLVGAGVGTLLWLAGQHPLLVFACAIGASVLFFKMAALFVVPGWIRRNMMTVRARGERPVSYTWNDHLLSWKAEPLSGARPWAEYVWMAEDEDVLLLFVSQGTYQVFPKPWFRDQHQLDEFRSLATRCLVGARNPAIQNRDYLAKSLPIVAIVAISLLLVVLVFVSAAP